MIRTTDDAGNLLTEMLAVPVTEFVRLQAAIADRAPDLRVHLTRAYGDSGPHVVEVMAPGAAPGAPWDLTAYITKHTHGWHLHDPALGPQMDLGTCQQVAKFLSAVPRFTPGWHEIWDRWMAARSCSRASDSATSCPFRREAPLVLGS
jgi:hypothetical protein